MAKRVFVTGVGPVTPIGIGREQTWTNAMAGKQGVRTIDRFDPAQFRSHVAGQVDDFDPATFIEGRAGKRLDRFSQFSVAAARLALEDAAYQPSGDDPDFGIWIGSALGGGSYAEGEHRNYLERGPKGIHPMLALSVFPGAACCNVAIAIGAHGPTVSNSNSCAAGAVAIGDAYRGVRDGHCRVALAGGADTPLSPLIFGSFDVIRAMSTRNDDPGGASRPFDAGRDGFVMSEGACLMLLESEEDVVRRGVTPYAEICGYSLTNDGAHMAHCREDGREAERAMMLAMREAGVTAADIDHVNAHGSATPLNDPTESQAIRRALGEHADRVVISGTKGMTGHALGATGAMEAGLVVMGLREQMVVPTINLETPADGCDLSYSADQGAPLRQRAVLSNSFGFGGLNAALVFRAVT